MQYLIANNGVSPSSREKPSAFPIFDLPGEIRQQIWEEVLDGTNVYVHVDVGKAPNLELLGYMCPNGEDDDEALLWETFLEDDDDSVLQEGEKIMGDRDEEDQDIPRQMQN